MLLARDCKSEAGSSADRPIRVREQLTNEFIRKPVREQDRVENATVARGRDLPRELEETLKSHDDRADRLEAWILAIGLGLRPAELVRLQRLLGRPTYTLSRDPPKVHRREDARLTPEDVEWALLTTADVTYRLWQGDAMKLGEPWSEEDYASYVLSRAASNPSCRSAFIRSASSAAHPSPPGAYVEW